VVPTAQSKTVTQLRSLHKSWETTSRTDLHNFLLMVYVLVELGYELASDPRKVQELFIFLESFIEQVHEHFYPEDQPGAGETVEEAAPTTDVPPDLGHAEAVEE